MTQEQNNKLQTFIEKLRNKNPEWFIRFFKMLEDCGVDEKVIDLALDLLNHPQCKYALDSHHDRDVLKKDKCAYQAIEDFFNYMENLVKEKGVEYLKDFLENAIIQMGMDLETYIKEEHFSKQTNFFNLFIRQLIKENPQDVRIDNMGTSMEDLSPMSSMGGNIEVSIAGVAVGHMHFEGCESNINHVQFTEFRTLPGLERLGLGSLMMSEFCRQLVEYKPGHAAVAWGVKKGRDGEKTYSAWGGYPVTTMGGGEYIEDRPWTSEEYDANNGQMLFFFPESAVKTLAEKQSTRYPNAHIRAESVIETN